jgi:microcystin degradation protein MlrC
VIEEMVARIPVNVDGIYLMLHGSAYARERTDPEGALLSAIRAKVGQEPLIAISMDLHAYYTSAMEKSVDIAVAYKTCPHIDLYETGALAAKILHSSLISGMRPKTHRIRIPMVTPPEKHDNELAPFSDLMNSLRELERRGALGASLLLVQPWLDVPELSWNALVVADESFDGLAAAKDLARAAWQSRFDFMKISAIPVSQALDQVRKKNELTVFADLGDATNGGSRGDSTELLRGLIAQPISGKVALSITDPDAVAIIYEHAGAPLLELTIGSGAPGEYNQKQRCLVNILEKCDSTITYTHPAAKGSTGNPGRSALVSISISRSNDGEICDIYVVLHEEPVRVIDPSIYDLYRLKLVDFSLVQAKSHVSFIPGFTPLTPHYLLADTLGPTTANLLTLDFTTLDRPTFPFDWGLEFTP